MSKIRQILRYFTQGKSKVFISQQTGASRNTVKRYIRKFLQEKLTFEDISGMQDADLEVLFVPSRPPDRVNATMSCSGSCRIWKSGLSSGE